jgi:hypothetical protein
VKPQTQFGATFGQPDTALLARNSPWQFWHRMVEGVISNLTSERVVVGVHADAPAERVVGFDPHVHTHNYL